MNLESIDGGKENMLNNEIEFHAFNGIRRGCLEDEEYSSRTNDWRDESQLYYRWYVEGPILNWLQGHQRMRKGRGIFALMKLWYKNI